MSPWRTRLAAGALAAGLVAGLALPVAAQMEARLSFTAGADSATANGTVIGEDYFDYLLEARAGQEMDVALTVRDTNGYGIAYFNILPPGSDGAAIFNGSVSAEDGRGSVRLPEDGDYTVRVYLMGNDRDTGKTVGYSLSVTIR